MKFEHYGIGIAKGMALTFKHLFRHPITTQYPEERLTVSRRIRGNELVWDKEQCTGCATCAKSCPEGCIEIITSMGEENTYIVDKFEVDSGRCIFCGLCVEACPFEALFMGYAYERARYRRQELVMAREGLLISGERQPSGYARPKVEASLPHQTLLLDRDRGEREKGGKDRMALLTQDNFMKLYSENWDHIRHMERYRMLCLNIYAVIVGGIIYALSTGRVESLFSYIAGFLVFFTIINLLIAIKIEAVTNNFVQANYRIVDELKMKDWAPIRTRQGLWNLIRFQWIFPVFYGISLVGIIVLIALH